MRCAAPFHYVAGPYGVVILYRHNKVAEERIIGMPRTPQSKKTFFKGIVNGKVGSSASRQGNPVYITIEGGDAQLTVYGHFNDLGQESYRIDLARQSTPGYYSGNTDVADITFPTDGPPVFTVYEGKGLDVVTLKATDQPTPGQPEPDQPGITVPLRVFIPDPPFRCASVEQAPGPCEDIHMAEQFEGDYEPAELFYAVADDAVYQVLHEAFFCTDCLDAMRKANVMTLETKISMLDVMRERNYSYTITADSFDG